MLNRNHNVSKGTMYFTFIQWSYLTNSCSIHLKRRQNKSASNRIKKDAGNANYPILTSGISIN